MEADAILNPTGTGFEMMFFDDFFLSMKCLGWLWRSVMTSAAGEGHALLYV